MEEENQLIKQRIQKLNNLRQRKINPYPYSFDQKDHAIDILTKFNKLKKDQKTKTDVSVAGRVMTLRVMGKAGFGHIQDGSGKIQIYVREDVIGKEEYKTFSKSDLGDIIGVKGIIFCTKKGEISIWVKKFVLLCKSIRPLPEKWHGLKDTEVRYRKRYLDLIVNPEVKEIFIKRTKVINFIREYLNKKNFLEVDTPILQPIYGGASARPFKTFLNNLKMDIYLRISNELYLKRLLVGGFERIYEFAKDFRNEGIDSTHNPEFTQIEIYQSYADFKDMMKLTEEIFIGASKIINGKTKVNFRGQVIDLKKPWKVMTMKEAIKKYVNINVDKLMDKELIEVLDKNNIEYRKGCSSGMAIYLIFDKLVSEKIIQPTFIIEHPIETTPLCKQSRKDPKLVERFEPFIGGFEVANGYSELNDPIIQRKLLEEQAKQLRGGDEEANPMDEDFIEAIETGMPPTGGVGIGIDRMMMLLCGKDSIKDVILFPFMKSFSQK
ncbi:lysine--tRNA ligase [Candidatus Woesearchaeota archaeon]|nr:lysine--tRNA ligase [Candidatus Woesearchaeota archaeon]